MRYMFQGFCLVLFVALPISLWAQACSCDAMPNRPANDPIPVEVIQNNIFVPVTLVHRGQCSTLSFNVDTGTTQTVVDTSVAKALMVPVSATTTLLSTTGLQAGYTAQIDCILIGGRRFNNVKVTIADQSAYSEAYRHPVAGLISMDLLQQTVTQIDFPGKAITLDSNIHFAAKPDFDIPLSFFQNLPILSCTISQSIAVDLVVDIGCDCEISVFNSDASNITLNNPTVVRRSDASRIITEQRSGTIDYIKCGDLVLTQPRVIAGRAANGDAFVLRNRPGLLGNMILSRYQVELDLKQKRLRLYTPKQHEVK